MKKPLLNMVSSFLYAILLCFVTGGVGIWLVISCYDSVLSSQDKVGLVRSSCLVTGGVMLLFVVIWSVFMVTTVSASSSNTCPDKRKKNKTEGQTRCLETLLLVLGRISFTLLLLTIITELASLGFMWWTSFSLAAKFKVVDNCFCVQEPQYNLTDQVSSNVFQLGVFNISIQCDTPAGMVCRSAYQDTVTQLDHFTANIR